MDAKIGNMEIDVAPLREAFFDEAFEKLNAIESHVLTLDKNNPDMEVIHSIFRTAHSIKSDSLAFDLVRVSKLAHAMEDLLHDVRDGATEMTDEMVAVLLKSVDYLRNLLTNARGL